MLLCSATLNFYCASLSKITQRWLFIPVADRKKDKAAEWAAIVAKKHLLRTFYGYNILYPYNFFWCKYFCSYISIELVEQLYLKVCINNIFDFPFYHLRLLYVNWIKLNDKEVYWKCVALLIEVNCVGNYWSCGWNTYWECF